VAVSGRSALEHWRGTELLLTLGRDRWGQKATDLGAALGKKADTISYLAREGIRQRLEVEDFARRYEALDQAMIDDAW